jgi:biopolymer transport protein ExbD
MGAVDIGGGKERGKKKGKKRKRRVGIRIDMTPMVDVAFLLLIFFMVTTVFRTPQALEINLPPKDVQVPIAESNVLTIRVLPDDRGSAAGAQDSVGSESETGGAHQDRQRHQVPLHGGRDRRAGPGEGDAILDGADDAG